MCKYMLCQISCFNFSFLFPQEIALVAQSESKWKQLGELAMSDGKVLLLLDLGSSPLVSH